MLLRRLYIDAVAMSSIQNPAGRLRRSASKTSWLHVASTSCDVNVDHCDWSAQNEVSGSVAFQRNSEEVYGEEDREIGQMKFENSNSEF